MKKIVITIFLGVFLLVGFASSAQAAWYTCTVDNVGATSTGIRVRLTDTKKKFTSMWFEATGQRDKEIMAAALSAMALGNTVMVQLNTIKAFAPLSGLYLNK